MAPGWSFRTPRAGVRTVADAFPARRSPAPSYRFRIRALTLLARRLRGRDGPGGSGGPPGTGTSFACRGEAVMEWLAGTVVGFVVILTVVVVLARGSTERWEKEKRVALRPRV